MNEQYVYMHKDIASQGRIQLGAVSSACWRKDPHRFLFSLSRYKFVSKMMKGKKNIIEIGCGDAWNSNLVARNVEKLCVTDADEKFSDEARLCTSEAKNITVKTHNLLDSPTTGIYDGLYALDVLEHIDCKDEDKFIDNAISSCTDGALYIFGMPSLESQSLISPEKRDPGHINCKSKYALEKLMNKHFLTVIMFSMNDEVIHTGHEGMSHYIFAICSQPVKSTVE